MSARLLNKVLKEREQQKQHVIEEEEQLNGGESESPDSGARSSVNPFDLLNEGDDEDEGNPDQMDAPEVADETLTRKEEPPSLRGTTNVVSRSNNKSKKKKKKKSKEGSSSMDKHETPLDVTLDALSLDGSSSGHQSGSNKPISENAKDCGDLVKQYTTSILQVDPKYLNVENELRRIFGSKVVKSFEKSNQSSTSRQVRGGRRGSHHIRKTVMISPSDHWPRWDGSLSMEFLETKDGYHYFRYAHSSSYDQAQRAFEAAQAIHDLNGVASVLLYHPYHLDSLITMADYFKFVGEHQMSADAIAKCLYALECAWHPMFTPLQGNCQLKFSHDTNKPIFKALFTHMKNMDRRGCHRSALEVCKLLLAFDSDDPMGAMFCLDYFALRAGEYAWLEQFSEDYRSDSSLWLFPNFSYSLAVCRFYLEQEESSHNTCVDGSKAFSADLMNQALMLHPSVLKKLVAKVPLKDQAWTNILKNSFFNSDQIGIPSLDHLINIYVERNYLIWRLPDLQKLLRNGALLVIETLGHNKSDAKDWACVRKEAFSSGKNEYGHLLVQEFSDTVQTLPPDNLQNFMVDMREAAQIGGQVANPPAGGHAPAPRDVANRNPLAVLFESLLPWVNYGDAGDGIVDENQVNGQGQDDEDH
ncbi:TCF25/Rqc1 - like 1 [Theobroma cacao]|uniref:Nulp1-type, putative n=1 Tax=Theobroma cacao TaxID=3641 RepID=A0A061DS07_THECC|nr:Nulp1-type, putative [Theobroma cacao]WRX09165.1 TCF25/Rqc1 - like 1 [Theobroma cacao]